MRIVLTPDGGGLDLDKPPYETEGLTMCIIGNKGAGKSNMMAVMAEESHRNQIPFVYFDPNGDAASLRKLGDDVVVIGNVNHDEPIRRADYPLSLAAQEASDFVRMALVDGYSLVLDLTEYQLHDDPLSVFSVVMNEHYRQAGKLREPVFVFVDEAHCFAPQNGADRAEQVSRRSLGRVATDGRKRGMLLVTATQRATYLDKRIVFGANVRAFGKITYFPDYEQIKHYTPYSFSQMRQLKSGEVVIVTDGKFGKVKIRRRETPDLGKTPAFNRTKRRRRPSLEQLRLEF